jgi:hypothetical protein
MDQDYTIEVWLNEDRDTRFTNWDQESGQCAAVHLAAIFHVNSSDPEAAAEKTFAICNSSWPDEIYGGQEYAHIVRQYRDHKNRSLSVGDIVKVNEQFFVVASGGFRKIAGLGVARVLSDEEAWG